MEDVDKASDGTVTVRVEHSVIEGRGEEVRLTITLDVDADKLYRYADATPERILNAVGGVLRDSAEAAEAAETRIELSVSGMTLIGCDGESVEIEFMLNGMPMRIRDSSPELIAFYREQMGSFVRQVGTAP